MATFCLFVPVCEAHPNRKGSLPRNYPLDDSPHVAIREKNTVARENMVACKKSSPAVRNARQVGCSGGKCAESFVKDVFHLGFCKCWRLMLLGESAKNYDVGCCFLLINDQLVVRFVQFSVFSL